MDALTELFADRDIHLNADEVASILGIPRPTVYLWLQHGTLPGYKVGGSWIVLRDELRQHLTLARDGGDPSEADAIDELLEHFPTHMSMTQTAQALGVSQFAVQKWLASATLPGYRLGSRWVVLREELAQHLRNLRSGNEAPVDGVPALFHGADQQLRPSEVATRIGVPSPTLYQWLGQPDFPAYKLGPRTWMILRDEAIAWMRAHRNDQLTEQTEAEG